MTSAHLALLVLDALLLAAGLALLHGLGLVRSGRDALRHAALALVAGWAALGVVLSTALVLGAPVSRLAVVLAVAGLAAAGLLLGRRVPARPLGVVGERGPAVWVAVAGAAVLFVQLAALARRALGAAAPTEWDVWAFWLPKARSLLEHGGLDTGVGGFTSFASPSYPPLAPALEAAAFAFTGDTSAEPLAFQHWVVAAAFFGALASLLAARVRPAILWPALALLSVLPTFRALVGSSLGDEPLMLLLALGGVCCALWLLEPDPQLAALGALFLAAAALTKTEGLPIALVLTGTTLVAALARRPRRPLAPVLLLVAPVAAFAPWVAWLRANDVARDVDYQLSDALDLGLLRERADRLSYAADELPQYLLDPDRWLLAVPLMLVAALLALPRRPALSALAVVPVLAVPAGLLLVYWIGLPPVDWYVATSAARVTAPAVVLAAVFLPLLLAEALRRGPR